MFLLLISGAFNNKIMQTFVVCIATRRLKAAICPSAGRGFAEHVPMTTRPLLDGELLEHVSTATNTTEEAMHCMQSHVDSQATHTETFPFTRQRTSKAQ
jgi:hypothetical protein